MSGNPASPGKAKFSVMSTQTQSINQSDSRKNQLILLVHNLGPVFFGELYEYSNSDLQGVEFELFLPQVWSYALKMEFKEGSLYTYSKNRIE